MVQRILSRLGPWLLQPLASKQHERTDLLEEILAVKVATKNKMPKYHARRTVVTLTSYTGCEGRGWRFLLQEGRSASVGKPSYTPQRDPLTTRPRKNSKILRLACRLLQAKGGFRIHSTRRTTR